MRTSAYISKAACHGYRPARFASHNSRQRPHLITRLAKERTTARFIVAPNGYGKTSLAIDYAETMFSWTHVFWLNAQSPCFIRDLDAACIAQACLKVDSEAKLVVIDDLPQLDPDRAQQLSHEIDVLLSRGSEVIVACVPSCDLFGSKQVDRLQVGPGDLLLNDEEVDMVRTEVERSRLAAANVPAAQRVPALAWATQPTAADTFVASCFAEDLPADLLLASCSAFALQAGAIADMADLGPIDPQVIGEALSNYPHLGFDAEAGTFEAPLVDVATLAHAAKPRMEAIVARSIFESRDALVQAWSAILLGRGLAADRACDLVRAFCPVKRRAQWLVGHAWELVRSECFHAPIQLVQGLRNGQYESRERVLAIEAVCRRMLADEAGALRCAKRCAFDTAAPRDVQAIGLMVVERFGPGTLKRRASSALSEWAASLQGEGLESAPWHDALVVAWDARQRGIDQLVGAWSALHAAEADEDVLCLVSSWLYASVAKVYDEGATLGSISLVEVERYVRSRIAGDEAITNFFAASAGLSMEEAHTKGMPYGDGPLEAAVLVGLRRVEMAMIVQRREFEQAQQNVGVNRSSAVPEGLLLESGKVLISPVEKHVVPLLELKMFGRLEALIGGVAINPDAFARKQVRVLLTLLAANRGRDLSRDTVARSMWPKRDERGARRNFYATWSQLRHALMLSDGTCPYLVRHQYGCHLDERYVRSDVGRFDDICRELLFGRVVLDDWLEIYNELDRDFSGELMPTEVGNVLVDEIRLERRTRLVDALVSASLRLIDEGSAQWAIWFARSAVAREQTREDAYAALMRAQIAYNQRTAAMMTYLSCRKVLADELGIDPSPELTALYESLLGS